MIILEIIFWVVDFVSSFFLQKTEVMQIKKDLSHPKMIVNGVETEEFGEMTDEEKN
jgi:hypothetical protein